MCVIFIKRAEQIVKLYPKNDKNAYIYSESVSEKSKKSIKLCYLKNHLIVAHNFLAKTSFFLINERIFFYKNPIYISDTRYITMFSFYAITLVMKYRIY